MADILGAFEQAVLLTTLHLEKNAYGRAILRGLDDALGREVAAGALYATLDRLEAKKYVRSFLGEATPDRGGRPRRYFHVTAAGIRALNDSKAATEAIWQGVSWPIRGSA